MFRAIEVEDRGAFINVTARVKDDSVAQALEAARGDRWNRGAKGALHLVWPQKYVKVAGVHVTTTTARSKMFRLELEVDEAPQDSSLEFSVGGMTPDDLTERALRTVLFGERNPLAEQHMGFAAEID